MTTPRKIEGKIVGQEVRKSSETPVSNVIHMHETVERPDVLHGSTYKISPVGSAALYITINDIVLNEGTPHEVRRPFEIFINSKDTSAFQWIIALTRMISAVFRKGGDITFISEELRSVFDPQGGYFVPGGSRVNSVVGHIGTVIDTHMRKLGMLEPLRPVVTKEFTADQIKNASTCPSCQEKTLVLMDGCATCVSCGHSKCG